MQKIHQAFIPRHPLKFLSMYCKYALLISGLGHTRIHVRKSTGFLLCLDCVMTPELMLVTVIIHTNHWKGHCAPFLVDKNVLFFFKMGAELCHEIHISVSNRSG